MRRQVVDRLQHRPPLVGGAARPRGEHVDVDLAAGPEQAREVSGRFVIGGVVAIGPPKTAWVAVSKESERTPIVCPHRGRRKRRGRPETFSWPRASLITEPLRTECALPPRRCSVVGGVDDRGARRQDRGEARHGGQRIEIRGERSPRKPSGNRSLARRTSAPAASSFGVVCPLRGLGGFLRSGRDRLRGSSRRRVLLSRNPIARLGFRRGGADAGSALREFRRGEVADAAATETAVQGEQQHEQERRGLWDWGDPDTCVGHRSRGSRS